VEERVEPGRFVRAHPLDQRSRNGGRFLDFGGRELRLRYAFGGDPLFFGAVSKANLSAVDADGGWRRHFS
jgi:hypothetical protein